MAITSVESIGWYERCDDFAANCESFMRKLLNRFREDLEKKDLEKKDLGDRGTGKNAANGQKAGKTENRIRGEIELKYDNCDWMDSPSETIKYNVDIVTAAAIKGEADWIEEYMKGNNKALELLGIGYIGLEKNGRYIYKEASLIYALWARIIWIEPKYEHWPYKKKPVGEKILEIFGRLYNDMEDADKKRFRSFLVKTIANITYADKKELAADMFRIKLYSAYMDWVHDEDKTVNLPFSMVYDRECEDYKASKKITAFSESKQAIFEKYIYTGYSSLQQDISTIMHIIYTNDMRSCWFDELEEDSKSLRAIRKKRGAEWDREYEEKLLSLFEKRLTMMRQVLSPEDYLSFLNEMWQSVDECAVTCRVAPVYDEEIPNMDAAQMNTIEKKMSIKNKGYIDIIKGEIQSLDDEGVDVKTLYVRNDIRLNREQFMFYNNVVGDRTPMVLGINALKKIGIPEHNDRNNDAYFFVPNMAGAVIDREALNAAILEIWRKSKIKIPRDNFLYKFQKDLVMSCSEDEIITAAACGIFPKNMRGMLLDYVVKIDRWDIVPALIAIKEMTGAGGDDSEGGTDI